MAFEAFEAILGEGAPMRQRRGQLLIFRTIFQPRALFSNIPAAYQLPWVEEKLSKWSSTKGRGKPGHAMFLNGKPNLETSLRLKPSLGELSRDDTVVRAPASHQCVPGSIPGPTHVCVEFFVGSRPCSEGFSRVHRFSSLHNNQHFQIPI